MEKAKIQVGALLTLIGQNTIVRILDDEREGTVEEKTVFFGVAAKVRRDQVAEKDIKHISPLDESDSAGRHVMRIYIYND